MKRSVSGVVSAFLLICASLPAAQVSKAAGSKGVLLVANSNDEQQRQGEGYLAVYDPDSGTRLATIPDGGVTAHEVVVSPDNRLAYLPIYSNANIGQDGTDGRSISVVDIGARKVVGSIEFDRGVRPHYGRFNRKDGMLYVTTEIAQAVAVIDPKTRKVVASIPTGQPTSHNVAVSHDGRRAYTSNVQAGTVSVLDLESRKLVTVIPVAPAVPGDDSTRPIDARNWRVQRVTLSKDDKKVFTCDWITSAVVAIDTATSKVSGSVPLPSACYNLDTTLDGRYLLAIPQSAKKLVVIDIASMTAVRTIDMPATPQQVLVRPDGKVAYVSCDVDRKVVAVNTSTWQIEKSFDTGYWPDGLAWAAVE